MGTPRDADSSDAARREGALKILVHDYSGHAFPVQLSRELARRGHGVLHLHSASFPTPKGPLAPRGDDPPGFEIDGLSLDAPFRKYDFFARRRQERKFGRLLAARVEAWKPDVVVAAQTPLDTLAILQDQCVALGAGFVFWVQDVYGVAIDRILRRRLPVLGHLVGSHYKRLERRLARRSHALVVITEDFLPLFADWGVPRSRLHVIENWAPIGELPECPRDNAWARRHGLADKLCLLYAGTLGLKHDPALLLRLAERFSDRPEVRVVVISEGLGADWLAGRTRGTGADGLLLLGYQPYESLPEVLASGDVLVTILEPDAGIYSVPSKVLSYLCAGRPLLAAIPPRNLAARIISRNEAGLVVDPGDADGLANAAETLVGDGDLRQRLGRNARAYAERTFDIGAVATRFEAVIRRAAAERD